jgi:hypothetical protein
MARKFTINDKDRGEWIDNDEGLYLLWKRSRKSKKTFIKDNRGLLDEIIIGCRNGDIPVHYLAYR